MLLKILLEMEKRGFVENGQLFLEMECEGKFCEIGEVKLENFLIRFLKMILRTFNIYGF